MEQRKFLIGPDADSGEVVTADFTSDEWSTLKEFYSYTKELQDTALLRKGFSYHFGFSFNADNVPDSQGRSADNEDATVAVRDEITMALRVGDGEPIRQTGVLRITARVPPKDQISAALHLLRPMLLKGESTYFFKVCSIVARRVDHKDVRDGIGNLRDIFNGRLVESTYQLGVGSRENRQGLLVNSGATFLKWLNAFEYHRDREKREGLESVHGLLPLGASEVIFVQLLGEKIKAIFGLAEMLTVILGHSKKQEFKIHEFDLVEPDPDHFAGLRNELLDDE